MDSSQNATVIWSITDGKLGHLKQVRGLVQAIARHMPVTSFEVRAQQSSQVIKAMMMKRYASGEGLPAPDLIVGAGHGTHLNMLAAQRVYGGKTVVLMNPSLPRAFFDLCLIPEHDGVASSGNVITTRGALNQVRPSLVKSEKTGLVLLGGPSRHFHWEDGRLVLSIHNLVKGTPAVQWVVTTSPRTPVSTINGLQRLGLSNLQVMPMGQLPFGWLENQLEVAGQVWVTPDSVSMVYEALTAGSSVGVFDLKAKSSSRVVRGLERLRTEGWVTSYRAWRPGMLLPQMAAKLDEASRCAVWIKSIWFPSV